VLAVAVGAAMLAGFVVLSQVSAQSAIDDWEKAAGGKMSFDVASVNRNVSGLPPSGEHLIANFPLDDGDAYTADRGFLS
jgi:hypothetical protein